MMNEVRIIKKADIEQRRERELRHEIAYMYVLIDRHREKARDYIRKNNCVGLQKTLAKAQDVV